MTVREVWIVAPDRGGLHTGNETSVARARDGLRSRGVRVEIVRGGETVADVRTRLGASPDVVHAFHARRTGPLGLEIASSLGVPLVVTLTGTDTDVDLFRDDRVPVVTRVLRRAAAIICGHEGARQVVARLRGSDTVAVVVPKGVVVAASEPRPAFPRDPAQVVVLHVAHLREVKNNLLTVRAVLALAREGLPVRVQLLGAALDESYAVRLRDAAGGDEAWRRIWHPPVPHEQMGGWYTASDVVLNTSHGEGGSNAVLEAMAHGRAVVASSIPANVAYVGEDGSRGRLYPASPGTVGEGHAGVGNAGAVEHDEAALADTLRELVVDPALRERLGAKARRWVSRHHRPEIEIEALLGAYQRACAG